jgi:radical SAM superfamily enzyme
MQVILFNDVRLLGYLKYAGPYKIASDLRSKGYTVQVVDYFTFWTTGQLKEIIRDYLTDQTLWVGFTTTFNSNTAGRINKMVSTKTNLENILGRSDIPEIFDFIKKINPKVKLVAGGHKVSSLSLSTPIDYIITGQGESSAIALTDNLTRNIDTPRFMSEGSYPYNDFTSSRINYVPEDIIFNGEHLSIEFARGCIFKCSFCNYPLIGKKLWEFVKPARLIADEMQKNYDLFKTQGYLVTDDTINDSEEKVEALHKELTKLPFDLTLSSYARIDLMLAKPHTLDMLYEIGFRNFFFGIETFNQEAGKSIGKGMDPTKIKNGLEWIKNRYPDLMLSAGIIFGLPYETKDSIKNTIEYLKSSPLDNVSVAPLGVTADSSIGKNPSKYQFTVNTPVDWTSSWMTFNEAEELARQTDEMLKPKNKACWWFLNRLMNCGFDFEYLANTPLVDCHDEVARRMINRRIEYYHRITKI